MGHCIIMLMLCIVSLVLFTCDSLQLSSSAHNDLGTHAASDHEYQLTYPGALPRKLKFGEDQLASVRKVYINGGDQDLSAHSARKDVFSVGKAQNKEITKRKHAPIRTWREWVEAEGSDDTSQYFTMDYSRVRRRRPIHNKSLPVAP